MQISNQPITTETMICRECNKSFDCELVTLNGRTVFQPLYCDPCNEKLIQRQDQDAQRRAAEASSARFRAMVPPMYLDTDEKRIVTLLRAEIQNWEFGPVGLGFVGRSGAGKTRAAVCLLQRMHDDGHNVFFISATDLALNSANQFADNPAIREISRSILKVCRSADILLLDDLGKGRMTDRAESELYDLLEYRTSHRLPTIWTSNSGGEALLNMFSDDRGEAIIRRIGKEFSTIVKL